MISAHVLQLADDWIFGPVLCHVIPAVFGIVVCASTLTLTVIAADRFALIVIGVRERMSPGTALILVAIITAISTVMSLPIAIFSRLYTVFVPYSRRFCVEVWPSRLRSVRHLYTVGTLVVQHFLPLTVIAILYLLIFRHVRASRKQTGRQRVVSKTNRMLVAVVALFAIAWTPYQLFSMVSELRPELLRGPYFRFADLMLRVVAMASSGVNPILYGWMNANFRSAFLSFLRRKKPTFAGNSVVIGGSTVRTGRSTVNVDQNHSVVRTQQLTAIDKDVADTL
jgi:7 transmembrane receptor (rhodopsin family)